MACYYELADGQRWIRVLAAFSCAVATSTTSNDGRACTYVDGGFVRTPQVPQNGAIVIDFVCSPLRCPTPEGVNVAVTNGAGEVLAGSLRVAFTQEQGSFIAVWVPDKHTPFSVADRLTVSSPYIPDTGLPQVEIVSALDEQPYTSLASVDAVFAVENDGQEYCCDGSDCFSYPCISEGARDVMQLFVDATSTQTAGDAGRDEVLTDQYMYRLVLDNGAVTDWDLEIPTFEIATQQEQYCVALEMEHLVDGTRATTPFVCVPYGDHPPLQYHPTSIEDMRTWLANAPCDDHGLVLPALDGGAMNGDASTLDAMSSDDARGSGLTHASNASGCTCAITPSASGENRIAWTGLLVAAVFRRLRSRRRVRRR